jgi:hypothetical protein
MFMTKPRKSMNADILKFARLFQKFADEGFPIVLFAIIDFAYQVCLSIFFAYVRRSICPMPSFDLSQGLVFDIAGLASAIEVNRSAAIEAFEGSQRSAIRSSTVCDLLDKGHARTH